MSQTGRTAGQQTGLPMQQVFNQLVTWILQSPFHGVLSEHLMLLGYTGRRSGVRRQVPITYLQQGNVVIAFCDKHVSWWKNFIGSAPVVLTLRGRRCAGFATAITDDFNTMAPLFEAFLRQNRQAGGFQDVPFDTHGQPNAEALAQALPTKVLVRIELSKQHGLGV